MKKSIFYIDPQGGSGNLGMYDYELLSRMTNEEIYFIGEKTYDYLPLERIKCLFWFNYGNKTNNIIKALSYIGTMLRILLLICKKRPKVIHIQWVKLPNFDIVFYKLVKLLFKVKLVYTVHNLFPHKRYKGDFKEYGRMYRVCDALMVHTNKTKDSLVEEFKINPSRIHVAPHGPLRYTSNEKDLNNEIIKIRNQYKLKNKIVFSLVGIQSEYKGTDLLVKAWNDSIQLTHNNKICLIIAGKNASKFLPNDNIENLVCISRRLSDIEFEALMKISDVLVFPYRRIEQSGVLLTTIMERKPFCTTPVGELRLPIDKENLGWLIPEINSDSIKQTLEKIADNPEEIKDKQLNNEGWDRVLALYDWSIGAYKTKEVYDLMSMSR